MPVIHAIRGMNDILPEQTSCWQNIESTLRRLLQSYSYQEIRMPIVESTDLFKRSIGEVTDIVEKEMYTFTDRNGDSLTLRPEGTASCVRACIEHGLLHNQEQRLWYMGPMFRHERPQKGRYRQFHQVGVEVFGISTSDIDAELIHMTYSLWQQLGIASHLKLQINSLGTLEARQRYRARLVAYLTQHHAQLDEDSRRRLHSNPLRILDSKNPALVDILAQAPKLHDDLDEASRDHFTQLLTLLEHVEIPYEVNQRLVRGLDYYSRTAFEWVTESLGAQGTVCGGGRYDDLVQQLGGRATPAVGFAMGLERVLELYEVVQGDTTSAAADIYVIVANAAMTARAMQIATQIRTHFSQLKVLMHCGEASFKSQFKRADKSGAQMAIILGEEELQQNNVSVKYLREDKPQEMLTLVNLIPQLEKIFANNKVG